MDDLKNIIESLLFVAEAPIPLDRFKDVLETEDTKEIRKALEQLSEEYDHRKGGIFLSEVAGGYQIRTRPEYHEYVKRLLKPSAHRLSNAALETLAIIAYKQPIIRADIEHLRGVDCGGVLRVLMEKKLIRVLGRKEIPGRPLIYATTKHFLEVFELKNLKDLPSPKEIERHTDLPQEKLAAAALLDSNMDAESPEKVAPPSPDDQIREGEIPPSDDHTGETETSPPEDHAGEMEAPPTEIHATEAETPPSDGHTGETEAPPLEDHAVETEAIPSDDDAPSPQEEMPRTQEDTSGEEKSLDLDDQSPI